VDVLKLMNPSPWPRRLAKALFQSLVVVGMATAIAWSTWRGVLHIAYF
jgi:hypothetical protein